MAYMQRVKKEKNLHSSFLRTN